MKRNILLIFFFLLAMSTFGQRKVIIHLVNGDTIEKEVWEVERITFGETTPVTVEKPNENTAVDLGLSVKWANMNLGASSEEQSGLLVGWADPTGTIKSIENRFYPSEYPNEDIIGTKLDIVTSLWGTGWRLPSEEEFNELLTQCQWDAVNDGNGNLKGFNVSRNGKSIFLPVTGYRKGNDETTDLLAGHYWTGLLDANQKYARSLYFDKNKTEVDSTYRYIGLAIRPVFGSYYHVSFVSLAAENVSTSTADINVKMQGTLNDFDKYTLYWTSDRTWSAQSVDSLEITPGDLSDGSYTFHLEGLQYNTPYFYKVSAKRQNVLKVSSVQQFQTAYTHIDFALSPANNFHHDGTCIISVRYNGTLEKYKEIGLVYSETNDFANSKKLNVKADELDGDGYYTYHLSGLGYLTKYYYKAYALGYDSSDDTESESKEFTTDAKYASEAVDLGLPSGLKWSKYNLGAESENEIGGYFCWADPNEVGKDQSTYPRLVEHSPKNIGGTEYDVATKTLGGLWHIPDSADFLELRDYCTWTYIDEILTPSGQTVSGYKVSNPNDESKYIILIKGGNRQGDGTYYATNSTAYFWASNNFNGLDAEYFTFASSAKLSGRVSHASKYIGMNIRPVYGEVTGNRPVAVDSTQISEYDDKAVDLGLSVAWSSCDLGSSSDDGEGLLYAWGELESRTGSFIKDNYKYSDNLNGINGYANIGNDIARSKDYDPVVKAWGGNWHMPTENEFRELLEDCNWTWDSANSRFIITSTLNGNSIYWKVSSEGAVYWLSNLYADKGDIMYNTSAYYFNLDRRNVRTNGKPNYPTYTYRYEGKYIRPVKDPYDANKNK